MKIRLGPLARVRQERELRHAEDLARDVLDARLPHRTARVRKGAQGESTANGQRWIDLLGVELHFMGEDVDVRGGVVCLARVLSGVSFGGGGRRTGSDADEDHESSGYAGDHVAIDCDTSGPCPVSRSGLLTGDGCGRDALYDCSHDCVVRGSN